MFRGGPLGISRTETDPIGPVELGVRDSHLHLVGTGGDSSTTMLSVGSSPFLIGSTIPPVEVVHSGMRSRRNGTDVWVSYNRQIAGGKIQTIYYHSVQGT